MPRQVERAIAEYAALPAGERVALLERRLAQTPRCAVTRYLAGCECFDRGRPALGVRHMMVAHHAEPDFQSAALLVFSGLNWVVRRGEPLLTVLLETWEEFHHPQFDRYPRERALLDALAEPDPGLESAPPLARRLWRLPLRNVREQIRRALAGQDRHSAALLAPT